MNTAYGYFDSDGVFHYAESVATVGGIVYTTPQAEHYAAMVPPRLPLIKDNAPVRVGFVYYPTGWEYTDDHKSIQRTWGSRAEEKQNRPAGKYSKLRIITAAKALGKWDAIKGWIDAAGFSDEWAACMYVADDYTGFSDICATLISSGVLTREDLDQIMRSSIDDTLSQE